MAILALQDVKAYMKIDVASTLEDSMLNHFISAAQSEMELRNHRIYDYQANAVETHEVYECLVYLRRIPVVSVSQVKVNGTVVDLNSVSIGKSSGIVSGPFAQGDEVEVTYTGGYWTEPTPPPAGVQPLPADIKQQALELVAYLYENRGGKR